MRFGNLMEINTRWQNKDGNNNLKQLIMYTPTHLKIAYDIVGMNPQDTYGKPMWSDTDIQWAESVINFFKRLFKKARSMTGAWCLRIKMAWVEIKRKIYYKYISPNIRKVKIDCFYKILFKNGVYITLDSIDPLNLLWDSSVRSLRQLNKIINS